MSNQTTGGHSLVVKTAASGNTVERPLSRVAVPQPAAPKPMSNAEHRDWADTLYRNGIISADERAQFYASHPVESDNATARP
jgi:hypothetical protein